MAALTSLVWIVAVGSLGAPSVADAANGECVWEGGTGDPTYAYCKHEDCIGQGGQAQCTEPVIAPTNSEERSDGDKWEYSYGDCSAYGPWTAAWCNAAGGTWSYPNCLGLSSDHNGSIKGANNEGLAIGTSDAFANLIYDNPPSCSISGIADSGWGISSGVCDTITQPPLVINGITITDTRERVYAIGGTGCSGELSIVMSRYRKVVCPNNYSSRTSPNGDLHCFIPAKECCAKVPKLEAGDPVSLVDGSETQQELDYRSGGDHPLEFRRYYNSSGFFRHPGSGPDKETVHDHWHHNYDRVLIPVAGNSQLTAVLQRADFSLVYFDGSGNEILNRNGGGDHIIFQAGVGWVLTLANGDVERYDVNAQLSSITTRGGQVTSITRDGLGRIQTVTDQFGKTLGFGYDTESQLVSLTDPAGQTISYDYDSEGRLISVTYQDQTTKQYHYEDLRGAHWLTGITDEDGNRYSTYVYNAVGQVTDEQHAGGVEHYTFEYYSYPTSLLTIVTDPLGLRTYHTAGYVEGVYKFQNADQPCAACGTIASATYDSNGNVATSTNQRGYHTSYTYDATRNLETSRTEGLLPSSTPPEARTITTTWDSVYRLPDVVTEPNRVLDHDYDTAGNLTQLKITDTATSQQRIWAYTYNSVGQLLTADGPRTDVSDSTTYTYYNCATGSECGQLYTVQNAAGDVTTYDAYDLHGRPTHITDPNGLVTIIGYDLRGKVISREVGGETTTLEYDDAQQLSRVTLPDGSYLDYGYDAAHRLTGITDQDGNRIEYTLDGAGNRTAERVYDPLNTLQRSLTRVFDNRGRLLEDHSATDQVWAYAYDNNGNRISVTDPLDRTTAYTYDGLDRLASVTDAASDDTSYAYNAEDLLTDVEDPRGLVTTYEHNGWGDLISQQSPDTGLTVLVPDQAGSVATRTDARGETGTSAYDALQRLIETAYADQTIDYTYSGGTNQRGRLTSLSDGAGSTSWTYDTHGRVTQRSQTINGKTHAVGYAYNAAGQLSSMSTPSGQTIEYEYTGNHLTEIDVNGAPLLHSATYEPFGPVKSWTWGNGTAMSRSYDQDGRLTTISGAYATTRTWDEVGRITAILDDADHSRDTSYEYDALDRLTLAVPGQVADPPALAVSATSAAPGDTITVTVSNIPIGATWLALARAGDANTTYVQTAAVEASQSDYDFTMPAFAGTYELRLFKGATFTLLTTSPSITVSSAPPPAQATLVASAAATAPGSQVTVHLSGSPGGSTDWLALAIAGAPNTSYLQWTYVGSGITERDWTVTMPSTPGTYVFRLFLNNGYTLAASSANVVLSNDPPVLASASGGTFTLSTTNAAPGDVVAVTVDDIPTDTGHWLALARTSDGETVYGPWKAVHVGTTSTQWTVTMPPFAGTYEIRLLDGGTFDRDATSDAISVSAPATPSQTTLNPSATTAGTGSSVTVHLMAGTGGSSAWLALSVVGSANTSYGAWTYVGNGITERDWTVTMPSTEGAYEFRFYATGGYTVGATSVPITVTGQPPVGADGGGSGTTSPGSQTFTYDATGNRLTSIDAQGSNLAYTYDEDSNRLLSISGDVSRTYAYDAMGNVTSSGAGGLTYDDAGRLVGAGGREYFYNGLGQRVRKKLSASESIYYVYDEAGHLLGEYDTAGDLIEETVWLGDTPVATLRPAGGGGVEIFYVHTDHLNTPRMITQASNNAVRWQWDDSGFGDSSPDENPESAGAFEYNLRFPGQYFDEETGLSYNYFRDYDAVTGRYVESDPIGLDGGTNTYAYVYDDPFELVDPTGEFTYNKPPPATVPVSPDMEAKVSCLENCLGHPLVVTGGAETSGHTAHSLHYTGQAVDFGLNSNPGIGSRPNDFFCCALKCGFGWGQVEGAKQHRAPHYHLQVAAGNGAPRIPPGVCPSCQH